MRASKSGGVGVIREAEERHVGEGFGDILGVDARDVGDHEIGRLDALGRDEPVSGKTPLQLAAEKEVDPYEQDRRHAYERR